MTTGICAAHSALTVAIMWLRCPCTPPSETKPMTCAVPLLRFIAAMKSCNGGFAPNSPFSIARSIWPRSIATTRPAPILVCPTSELPICPRGRPTSGPWVVSVACGHVAMILSKVGVSASAGALPVVSSRAPHPSRIQRTTGFRVLIWRCSILVFRFF